MTLEQVLNAVMLRVKRSEDPDVRAGALVELIAAQEQFERSPVLPWFLLAERSITLSVGESTPLPDDFLAFDEDGIHEPLVVWNAGAARFQPVRRKIHSQLVDNDGWLATSGYPVGLPAVFDIADSRLVFRPFCAAAYDAKLYGYYADTAPTDAAVTTRWSRYAADLLIAEVSYRVAAFHLGDMEVAQTVAPLIPRAEKRIQDETTARQQSALLLAMNEEN